jgi:phosphoribosylformylglycinamidine (FGAM) synthase PurS component
MTIEKTVLKTRASQRNLIEVRLKSDYADAEGQAALALLQGVGLSAARECRASRLYEVRGPLNQGHVHQAARDLLCDPVTQDYRLVQLESPSANGMNRWRVEVWLKPTVTDPVGESVRHALIEQGLPAPDSVRCGVAYHVVGKCHRVQLEKAVARCLANPVVHLFTLSEEHA